MNNSSKRDGDHKRPRLECRSHHGWSSRVDSLRSLLRLGSLLGLLLFLSACTGTTVLLADFSNDTIGSAPVAAQTAGTVSLAPGAGTVLVVGAPDSGSPAEKWVRISHPTTQSQETTLTGDFARFDGIGNYGLIANLYLPSGTGVVTVQFEAFPQHLSFLHLDFMPEGDVRIDDGAVRFGHFPRDRVFLLSVNLAVTATTATAQITLQGGDPSNVGGGASGSIDVNVKPLFLPLARQFGAVKFWMGFQHEGSFFVDNIQVRRRNP